MKNYNINFLQSALDDLEEIVLYISHDNRKKALIWKDELIKKINTLSLFPEMGALIQDKKIANLGFRLFPFGNYVVYYIVFEQQNEITILRVLNAKRDYPTMFEKMNE